MSGASGACFGILGALLVVAHDRRISIWQSGLGLTLVLNLGFTLSVSGILLSKTFGQQAQSIRRSCFRAVPQKLRRPRLQH